MMAKEKRDGDVGSQPTTKESGGIRAAVQALIDANGHKRVDGRVASNRTKQHNAEVIHKAFRTLHGEFGMKIMPHNLADRHIAKLVQYWYEEGKAARTMRNDLSVLRKFAKWLGKPNLVRDIEEYLPNADPARLRVGVTAKVSKSWSEAGVDVEKKLAEAFVLDERFGMIIALQLAFGLRRKEAICVRPWVSDQRDLGKDTFILYTRDGTKGGRQRLFAIEFPFQVWVLDYIKQHVGKRDAMGWKRTAAGNVPTLKQNIAHYKYMMTKLGITQENVSVTGHGLRAEYAENCALLEGFVPATLGGTADQLPPEELMNKRTRVSERLGHSRASVTASYFGSFGRAKPGKSAKTESDAENSPAEALKGTVSASQNKTESVTTEAGQHSEAAEEKGEVVTTPPDESKGFLGIISSYYSNAPKGRKLADTRRARPDQEPTVKRAAKKTKAAKGGRAPATKKGMRKFDERQLRLPFKIAPVTRGTKKAEGE
jgi:Integrase/Phage integrase, N-terminal